MGMENIWGNGHVHHPDGGDGFMGAWICQNIKLYIYICTYIYIYTHTHGLLCIHLLNNKYFKESAQMLTKII